MIDLFSLFKQRKLAVDDKKSLTTSGLVCQQSKFNSGLVLLQVTIIHLLDRAEPDIRFVVQIEADVGQSKAKQMFDCAEITE